MSMEFDLVGSTDLPTRLRRAITDNDAQELEILDPVIRGLAHGLVRLSEIEALNADVAMRLVFAREKAFAAGIAAGSHPGHPEDLPFRAGGVAPTVVGWSRTAGSSSMTRRTGSPSRPGWPICASAAGVRSLGRGRSFEPRPACACAS